MSLQVSCVRTTSTSVRASRVRTGAGVRTGERPTAATVQRQSQDRSPGEDATATSSFTAVWTIGA